jgi:hypothetical protein
MILVRIEKNRRIPIAGCGLVSKAPTNVYFLALLAVKLKGIKDETVLELN